MKTGRKLGIIFAVIYDRRANMKVLKVFIFSISLVMVFIYGARGIGILEADYGARPISLGGAYVAVGGDASSVLWNPAGIPSTKYGIISIGFQNKFNDINYFEFFGTANLSLIPFLKDFGGYGGIGFVFWSTKEQGWNEYNEPTENISASEMLLAIAYKRVFAKIISAGISLKLGVQNIAGASDMALVIDVGAQSVIEGIGIGLLVKNIGIGSQTAKIPMGMVLGGYYTIFRTMDFQHSISASAELSSVQNVGFGLRFGGEYTWKPIRIWDGMLKIRLGYDFLPSKTLGIFSGLKGGLGISYYGFTLDYSLGIYGILGASHEINLSYDFDQLFIKLMTQADKIPPVVSIDISGNFITPDADGLNDYIAVRMKVKDDVGISSWGYNILDSTGNIVLSFGITNAQPVSEVEKEFNWDALDTKTKKALPDDIYSIEVWATDPAGNISKNVQRNIIVSSDPYLPILALDKSKIVSKDDKITITLARELPRPLNKWILIITDADGKEVKRISGEATKKQVGKRTEIEYIKFEKVEWDGTDNNGNLLANGVYYLKLVVEYNNGLTRSSFPIEIKVDVQ